MSLDQRKKHRIQKNIAEKLKLKRKQKPRRKLKPEDILNTDINMLIKYDTRYKKRVSDLCLNLVLNILN